jgi:hypothetical protein
MPRSRRARKSSKCNGKREREKRGRGSLRYVKKIKPRWICSRPSLRSALGDVFEVALQSLHPRTMYDRIRNLTLMDTEPRLFVRLRTSSGSEGFKRSTVRLCIQVLLLLSPRQPRSMESTPDTSSLFSEDLNLFKHGLSDPNSLANQKRAKFFDLLNRLRNTG